MPSWERAKPNQRGERREGGRATNNKKQKNIGREACTRMILPQGLNCSWVLFTADHFGHGLRLDKSHHASTVHSVLNSVYRIVRTKTRQLKNNFLYSRTGAHGNTVNIRQTKKSFRINGLLLASWRKLILQQARKRRNCSWMWQQL